MNTPKLPNATHAPRTHSIPRTASWEFPIGIVPASLSAQHRQLDSVPRGFRVLLHHGFRVLVPRTHMALHHTRHTHTPAITAASKHWVYMHWFATDQYDRDIL